MVGVNKGLGVRTVVEAEIYLNIMTADCLGCGCNVGHEANGNVRIVNQLWTGDGQPTTKVSPSAFKDTNRDLSRVILFFWSTLLLSAY
jgi:hypothetical protein